MGILNVTPDSFSDGGRYLNFNAAIAHAVNMWEQGADIIDVGGESTRPGAERVDGPTEISRVQGVVAELASRSIPVSIDTTRSTVAAAAIKAGATYINDVSGGLADPQMASVVVETGCHWVLMHWRGHSKDMQELATYKDVVAEVHSELLDRVRAACDAGVAAEKLIIDPGIGFAKLPEHNWALSARLDELVAEGYPVLFGSSRKSYLGRLMSRDQVPRPADERDSATIASSMLAFEAGVWGVRVHDVAGNADARDVWLETKRAAARQ